MNKKYFPVRSVAFEILKVSFGKRKGQWKLFTFKYCLGFGREVGKNQYFTTKQEAQKYLLENFETLTEWAE